MSKQEAKRLADALRRCADVDFDGYFAAAAALLDRWPDGEPYCYIYEWDTAGGVHRDTTLTRWNGAGPVRSIPVYTAPPAERLAELERERDHFKALWRAREPSAERIAALEEELASVLSDWNSLVAASGSPTNGGAVGHVAAMVRRISALEAALAERDRVVEQARVALERIKHATAPTHDDGGHHEAAHDLATEALRAIEEVRK